jgi:hypothetical protein
MAQGDIVWFDEAVSIGDFLTWAGTDDIKLAICDNTVAPTAATATPALGDFTEVGAAGTYTAGGTSLGTWAAVWSQSSGAGTLDSGTNPTWTGDASNDTDAYWGILYNDTQAGDPAFAYVDLGGPIDMTADLTVTWNASGVATLTKA